MSAPRFGWCFVAETPCAMRARKLRFVPSQNEKFCVNQQFCKWLEGLLGDAVGARPGAALIDGLALAIVSESELAGEVPAGILIDHAANVVRIKAGERAV